MARIGRRAGIAVAVTLVATVLASGGGAPAAADAAVSFDGESGTLAGISQSGNAAVTEAAARHGIGGLALSAVAEPSYARWNPDVVPQNHTHASVRTWLRVLSRGAGESVDLFTVQNARRLENFDFFVNGNNGRFMWDLYREDYDLSDFVVEYGRWYLVEAQVEFAGTDYSAQVRIDGVDQGTIVSTNTATTVRALLMGAESNKTHSQHYDDVAMQVGDAPLGWPATTPPSVSFTTPAEGASLDRGEAVAAAYTCGPGDFAVASCTGTVADGGPVDTSTLGSHTFTVTATDVAGYQTSVTHTYTVVDGAAPTVELAVPVDGAVVPRGSAVAADYTCADEAGGSGLASCDGPVADGSPIDTAVPGTHDFAVTATDATGNRTTVTHTYTVVDGSAPVVDLRTPPEGATYARGAAVAADYSCADEGGGSGLASCLGPVADGAPIDTSTLGARDFTVTATDAAGNTTSVTHTYTVTDQAAPTVELRRPAEGAVVARGEIVEADFACADETGGSGVAGCAGSRPSGTPIDTSVLGGHEFSVTATDAAGNTTTVTHTYTVVDRTSPTVVLRAPADGSVFARGAYVVADYECFDEVGGSGLRAYSSCLGPVAVGSPIDTWTLGARDFTVTANDAAGNVAWSTTTYTVLDNQPDNLIRERSAPQYTGDDVYSGGAGQASRARVRRGASATFLVRVQNDTHAGDSFHVRGGASDAKWRVTYWDGGRNVTAAVRDGTYIAGPLGAGQSTELRVVVRPTARTRVGQQRRIVVTSTAVGPGTARDAVVAIARRA